MRKARTREKPRNKRIIARTPDYSEENSDDEILLNAMNRIKDIVMTRNRDYWKHVIRNEVIEFYIYENYRSNANPSSKKIKIPDNPDDDLKIIQNASKANDT